MALSAMRDEVHNCNYQKGKNELAEIPKVYYNKIVEHIYSLAANPRPAYCKKLKNTENEYRIRVGVYRIIYTIEDEIVIITIVKIAHRKDVYDKGSLEIIISIRDHYTILFLL